jgi:DNA-binding NarL/FixJ family response regulator
VGVLSSKSGTKSRRILIISSRPLLLEGLKRFVEKIAQVIVIAAPDEESAESLCAGTTPDIVVIDRPHVRVYEPVCFLQQSDRPIKVVLIGWDDDMLAVCSRERVLPATLQNLANVIKECLPSKAKAFRTGKRNRIR